MLLKYQFTIISHFKSKIDLIKIKKILNYLINETSKKLISSHCFYKSILVSILMNSLIILIFWLLGISINIDLSNVLIFIPVVILISSLPITINGCGLREILMIYFLKTDNINSDSAFILSFSYGLLFILVSLLVCYFWFLNKK